MKQLQETSKQIKNLQLFNPYRQIKNTQKNQRDDGKIEKQAFIVQIKLKLMFLIYSLKCTWLLILMTLQKQIIIQFTSYYLCLIKQGFNLHGNNYLFISISNMIISKVEDCYLNIFALCNLIVLQIIQYLQSKQYFLIQISMSEKRHFFYESKFVIKQLYKMIYKNDVIYKLNEIFGRGEKKRIIKENYQVD
ncbi:unnamed protein product [Paramecium pentaurelia]|uniref:Transmembrane protein n=1 Tax=Paramecium pentaurelia TaxID=43138 RepID=A0A8S1W0A6_9CILI|nr:unnamed protein product [Paramecium pentaurelia]